MAALGADGVVIDALQYSNWDRALFEEWRDGGLDAVHVTVAYWETAREGSAAKPAWPDQPAWYRSPRQFPGIADGLRAIGMTRDEVAQVMGGNWLRFFADGFAPVDAAPSAP